MALSNLSDRPSLSSYLKPSQTKAAGKPKKYTGIQTGTPKFGNGLSWNQMVQNSAAAYAQLPGRKNQVQQVPRMSFSSKEDRRPDQMPFGKALTDQNKRASQASGLMLPPGGKQTKEQQEWYKSQRPQAETKSDLTMAPGGKQTKQQEDWYRSQRPQAEPEQETKTVQDTEQGPSTGYQAKSTIQQPKYIPDSTTQDSINNTLAQGYANADNRFQVKQLDRAGFSRGAGQNFIGSQEGVQLMQRAAQTAAETSATDQQTNDKMRSDYERAREMEAQNNVMIQHNLAQSDWARQFAEQALNTELEMAMLQAQLQLRLALLR
jgi:hypothetical protein